MKRGVGVDEPNNENNVHQNIQTKQYVNRTLPTSETSVHCILPISRIKQLTR